MIGLLNICLLYCRIVVFESFARWNLTDKPAPPRTLSFFPVRNIRNPTSARPRPPFPGVPPPPRFFGPALCAPPLPFFRALPPPIWYGWEWQQYTEWRLITPLASIIRPDFPLVVMGWAPPPSPLGRRGHMKLRSWRPEDKEVKGGGRSMNPFSVSKGTASDVYLTSSELYCLQSIPSWMRANAILEACWEKL